MNRRSEFDQRHIWTQAGPFQVTSELFLDVVFTSRCDCTCPWCIARTQEYAPEDPEAWKQAVTDAFRMFRIRNVIILGGEATIDPLFWEKLDFLTRAAKKQNPDHLILTTNGIRLKNAGFLKRLLESGIDAVNLSRMNDDQTVNDRIFGRKTLTREEIRDLYRALVNTGKTMRINTNVWRGNLDTVPAMESFVSAFTGCCDAVKFTPLMRTEMFGTVREVTEYAGSHAMSEQETADLWDAFTARHTLLRRASGVLGFVDYAEADVSGQRVILKYAQVEDKYNRDTVIPTLKIYPNGCLSNEWSFRKDIRPEYRK